MARFRVRRSFFLESRKLVVLEGEIAEGAIAPGMLVQVLQNSSLSMSAPIRSVEAIDHAGGIAYVGLCIQYSDSMEQALWRGMNLSGEVLDVLPEAPSGVA